MEIGTLTLTHVLADTEIVKPNTTCDGGEMHNIEDTKDFAQKWTDFRETLLIDENTLFNSSIRRREDSKLELKISDIVHSDINYKTVPS